MLPMPDRRPAEVFGIMSMPDRSAFGKLEGEMLIYVALIWV